MNQPITRLVACLIALVAAKVVVTGPVLLPAGIIMTTGTAQVVSAPESVVKGVWESNNRTRIFQEQSNMTLDEDVLVDITRPGVYGQPEDFTPETIGTGCVVDSYLLHQDAVGNRGNIFLHSSVTFDQDIVGLIMSNEALAATDPVLGADGTTYPSGSEPLRSLDFPLSMDEITISADRRTIHFDLQTKVALDHIRILTAAAVVPSPGSLVLLLLAGLTAARRRRRA
jgi:hypothetical protein